MGQVNKSSMDRESLG